MLFTTISNWFTQLPKQPRVTNGEGLAAVIHPGLGLPQPVQERIAGNGWYREEWATPYMTAVAHVVFRPDVTLTAQLAPERIIERLGLPAPDVTLTAQLAPERIIERLGLPAPDVTLTAQLAPERIIERLGPGGEAPITSPQTDLGVKPELGEWFEENRILVVVVIVALVLLFFFLKKGRR